MTKSGNMPVMTLLLFMRSVCLTMLFSCSQHVTEIYVRNFGAIPDDSKDDTPAITEAIKECGMYHGSKLIFESGKYDISGSLKDRRGNFEPSLIISGIQDLMIEGNGAELIGHNYSSMFHFENCSRVKLNNLSVDWDPLPYTQGRVTAVDSNYIDLEVLPPSTAREGLRTEAILGYDMEKHRMARRYTDHYQKGYDKTTVIVRPGVMRLFIGRQDRFAGVMPEAGTFIIARHQVYGYQAFEFVKCTGINAGNINIYSNPGMGFTGEECRDINLSHLKVMLRPGSGRWMSCTADATNFEACRGTINMENCLFEAQGDDATNVRSGEYMLVKERQDGNRLRIITGYQYGGNPRPPVAGDKMELSGKTEPLLPYTTLTVKSVELEEQGKALIVGFSEKLPERTGEGDIIANASSCPVLRIRNCTAVRNRARGFIIKTRDVIIEDCTLQDITASGVGLEADINAWWESIGSQNVIIRNNRFIDCKFEQEYLQGVIESHTMSQTAPAGVHKNIIIENNIFLGSDGNIIKLGSADGVNIINNIMDNPKNEAILLYNCKNINIKGNKLTNCSTPLKIGNGCDKTSINVQNNTGF